MITEYKLDTEFEAIKEAEKIKWVYLKTNPYGFETLAYKNYNDPDTVMDFLELYVDRHKIFNKTVKKKIQSFYSALDWSYPIDKKNTC